MRYSWLVCETTPRWSMAVRRFGPAALPCPDDAMRVISAAAPQIRARCNRAIAVVDVAVVLWVLERSRIAEVISALSASATSGSPTLHLAAMDQELTLSGSAGRGARLALHEWQVTAVLDAPQQLVAFLPLIRRHLAAIRPDHLPLDALAELTSGPEQ